MTLQSLPGGSQRFVNPSQYSTQDLRAPGVYDETLPTIGAECSKPQAVKGYPGLFYGTVTLRAADGPFKQEGRLPRDGSSRASGSLKHWQEGVVTPPIITNVASTPHWADTPYRMVSTYMFDRLVVGVRMSTTTTELMVEDPTTTLMSTIAGFTLAAIGNYILCVGKLEANGKTYLLVGYEQQKGGGQTLQCFDTLNSATWTPTYIPSGNAPVWGFAQLPDSTLMLYETNRITMVDVRSTAPASAAFTDHRATVAEGGYMVDQEAFPLGGGEFNAYIVVPKDGFFVDSTANELIFGPGLSYQMRGKLQRVSLDGWVVQDVDTGLPWVTFATRLKQRKAIMCCDTHTHTFNDGRSLSTMRWLRDRGLKSNQQIICRKHHTDGTRFWWQANLLVSGAPTLAWWEEVEFNDADPEASKSLPCSKPVTLTGNDTQSIGSWSGPFSPATKMLRDYAGGSWYTQYQPDIDALGYDLRKTAATGFVVGQAFEQVESVVYTKAVYPGMEGCPSIIAKIEAPPNSHIRTGQDPAGGYTTPAHVQTGDLVSGVGATFHARGPDERRPEKLFPNNRSWGYGHQFYITAARQTGGSDETRYAVNAVPVTFHLLFYKGDLGTMPRDYKDMDATRALRSVL